jgi:hypothetical protein
MPELGRALVVAGAVVVAIGLVLMVAPSMPWLGRLPGDVLIRRERFTFSFPIVTCLLVSLVLTLLLNLFFRR